MRRWFGPQADTSDIELQAGALILEEREYDRTRAAVHNAITTALRGKK